MDNDNIFGDEQLMSELDDPSLSLEGGDLDNFNFLHSTQEDMKIEPAYGDTPNIKQNNQLIQSPLQPAPCQTQMDNNLGLQQHQIPATPLPPQTNVFGQHYSITPNVNFNIPPPVVTLAPVTTQARQLLLPAKIIKSEPLVYSGKTQSLTTAPVQHQIHTLVNTGNGTVLATGKFSIIYIVFLSFFQFIQVFIYFIINFVTL